MTTPKTFNPVLKVRDMNGSKQVTIVSEIAKQFDLEGVTFVEEIVQSKDTLLLRFLKPSRVTKKKEVAGQGNQVVESIPTQSNEEIYNE